MKQKLVKAKPVARGSAAGKKTKKQALVYDPMRGAAALEKVMPLLMELDDQRLEVVNLDLQAIALVVLEVSDFIAQPAIQKRFALLPREVFDQGHVEALPDLAWAGWHVRIEQLSAAASGTKAMLPLDLVERATLRRGRMLKVLEYHLGDHPVAGPVIISIRAETGSIDLATDMVRCAKLYRQFKSLLCIDKRLYRPEDEAEARADSAEIMRQLRSHTGEAARWAELAARVWTVLWPTYEEVAATGRYLFRNDSRQERFPSLHSATRRTPARPAPAEPATTKPEPVPV